MGLLSLLGVLLLYAGACADTRRCQAEELCNGVDDDCDGLIDEDFVDQAGRYTTASHCGRCGLSCDSVFPSAQSTRCVLQDEQPQCELTSCAPGAHPLGSSCVADQPALCLPCDADEDCAARQPGARCLELAGDWRCGQPCGPERACPGPFRCDEALGQCLPERALCACEGVEEDIEVGCLTTGAAPERRCAGIARCGPAGLGACEITSEETCNGEDDDCDGEVDEDFTDGQGRYVSRLHCGACGQTCTPPGEHYVASCTAEAGEVRCEVACEEGFVDVDGIEASGCECQVFDGTQAPVASGGDSDCDGVVDDDSTFVHVSMGGSDGASGSLVAPMRTIQAALARAREEGKSVLVAQGSYAPFELVAGVNVFGGYRSDFRDRDPSVYPVSIEQRLPEDGAPVLICRDIAADTTVDGFTLIGSDAVTPGRGSTALLLDGCGEQVRLSRLTVISGRGAAGEPGIDAASVLAAAGSSPEQLAGRDGQRGQDVRTDVACTTQAGGLGGAQSCGGLDTSGGAGGAAGCPETGCVNGEPCANGGCADFTSAGVCDYARVLSLAVPNGRAGAGRGAAPGAAGAVTYNAPTSRGTCQFCEDNPTLLRLGQDGEDGLDGRFGDAGAGCDAGGMTFDALGRGSAREGASGRAGDHGSGGGGGSAGAGYDVIGGTQGNCRDVPGGSGGGGGSGGCGAPGGGGGLGGGASVGIALRPTSGGSGPRLTEIRVVTESGGRGGDGGSGAAGGSGGRGGVGGQSSFWCARRGGRGGDGGSGGAGGGGGGGCGGGSHAVAVDGPLSAAYQAELELGLEIDLAGVPGQGGRGGFSPGLSGGQGRVGADAAILVVD